ncbi:MAG: hypothetical protein A2328_01305, partial [Bdellovibrionales bacterium RIFOXYB2_FULL_36_6]
TSPSYGRGTQRDIAQHLGCKTAYISQILKGYLDFTLEQGIKLNVFFKHTEEESHFFLLQVQYARAGSHELKLYFEKQMNTVIDHRRNLMKRLKVENTLNENFKHIYYSAWYYAAVHIMLTIPQLRSVHAISNALDLPRPLIIKVLDFLVSCKLAVEKKGVYESGAVSIHLSSESIQIQRHHTNWRNKAIQAIDKNLSNNLHYSSVVSMSESDISKVREALIKTIEDFRAIVKESREERIQVICLDFFKLF